MASAGNVGNNVLSDKAYEDLKRLVLRQQRAISNLENRLSTFAVRRHQGVYMPQSKSRLAVLDEELVQGGSANAKELRWNSSDELEYTGREFTVWDFHLNSGQSEPAGVKFIAQFIAGRYVLTDPFCDVSDTLPEE